MIAVHPLDYPLLKAFFEGRLDIQRFTRKREELWRRSNDGENLGELIAEAKAFAAPFLPKA